MSRWLDPNLLTPEQKISFCPFGAGSRVCIGLHLARIEIRLATALMFKKCPGLRLDTSMEDHMMEMQHFFLTGPIRKHCNVTM